MEECDDLFGSLQRTGIVTSMAVEMTPGICAAELRFEFRRNIVAAVFAGDQQTGSFWHHGQNGSHCFRLSPTSW